MIDFEGLQVRKPEIVHDMPANGRRFIQRVEGYETTIVRGHADLRAGRAHRRPARPAGARRSGRLGGAGSGGVTIHSCHSRPDLGPKPHLGYTESLIERVAERRGDTAWLAGQMPTPARAAM